MKILQIINSLATGGAEKLIIDTVPLYNSMGIEMDVLVLNGAKHPFLKKLIQLKCCKVFSLGHKSVYNILNIFKIIPFLKKYDVVHVHLFPALYWVAVAKLLSFSNVKLIYTEHSTSNRRRNSKVFRVLDKIVYYNYKAVICITTEVKTVLTKHLRQSDSKFAVINNGVDLDIINTAVSYKKVLINKCFKEDDTILIQVAGFREPKDQPTLIKSLVHLPDTVKLILVGDGVLRKECEELVMQLKLQARVFFLGVRMDIPSLLKTADIVVLSSKYEGLSLSSIEGMTAGKPFIASNVPGLSDIVRGAGILFECGNELQLAETIKVLLEDKKYSNEVMLACKKRAKQYDINKMILKHIQLYEDVCQT